MSKTKAIESNAKWGHTIQQGDYIVNKLADYIDNAPEAGFVPINYGPLETTPQVLKWEENSDGVRRPNREPLGKGQNVPEGATLEMGFTVELPDMNPNLEFNYERSIAVRRSSAREKSDWSEIVEPSLVAAFGKDWVKRIVGKKVYVEVEDVPNYNGRVTKAGKVWSVPKFLAAYKDKAQCEKARTKRFGQSSNSSKGSSDIPDAVVAQVEGLLKSVGEDTARKMLEGKPFGDYDPETLMSLV